MTAEEALAELERCAGTQFDPGVVAAFAKVVAAGISVPAAAAGSFAA
jgi:response regulator RpfG family c-di-GMP phosphodiesterase